MGGMGLVKLIPTSEHEIVTRKSVKAAQRVSPQETQLVWDQKLTDTIRVKERKGTKRCIVASILSKQRSLDSDREHHPLGSSRNPFVS